MLKCMHIGAFICNHLNGVKKSDAVEAKQHSNLSSREMASASMAEETILESFSSREGRWV